MASTCTEAHFLCTLMYRYLLVCCRRFRRLPPQLHSCLPAIDGLLELLPPSATAAALQACQCPTLVVIVHLKYSVNLVRSSNSSCEAPCRSAGCLGPTCQMQPPPLRSAHLRVTGALSAHLPLSFLRYTAPFPFSMTQLLPCILTSTGKPVCRRVRHGRDQSVGRMFAQPMHIMTTITPRLYVALCLWNRRSSIST